MRISFLRVSHGPSLPNFTFIRYYLLWIIFTMHTKSTSSRLLFCGLTVLISWIVCLGLFLYVFLRLDLSHLFWRREWTVHLSAKCTISWCFTFTRHYATFKWFWGSTRIMVVSHFGKLVRGIRTSPIAELCLIIWTKFRNDFVSAGTRRHLFLSELFHDGILSAGIGVTRLIIGVLESLYRSFLAIEAFWVFSEICHFYVFVFGICVLLVVDGVALLGHVQAVVVGAWSRAGSCWCLSVKLRSSFASAEILGQRISVLSWGVYSSFIDALDNVVVVLAWSRLGEFTFLIGELGPAGKGHFAIIFLIYFHKGVNIIKAGLGPPLLWWWSFVVDFFVGLMGDAEARADVVKLVGFELGL